MCCFFVCLFVCLKGIERSGSGNYRVDGWLVLAGIPGNWARTISAPLCVNMSETASWTLGYELKTKFCVKVIF